MSKLGQDVTNEDWEHLSVPAMMTVKISKLIVAPALVTVNVIVFGLIVVALLDNLLK